MSDGDDDTSPIVSDDDDTSPVVSDDDNDQPTLSAHALAALTQFYEDQKSREEADECKNAMPEEDWVNTTGHNLTGITSHFPMNLDPFSVAIFAFLAMSILHTPSMTAFQHTMKTL